MRLGIDAQHLSHNLTGIGRYTWEVLRVLAQHPIEIIAYLPSSPVVDITLLPQVRFKVSHFRTGLGRTLWAQTVLPWSANHDKLDIFWGPAHRLPFLLNRSIRSAVTIHDITWQIVPQTMRRSTYWLERLCMPYTLRRADVIASDSRSTTRDLLRLKMVDGKKIHTVHLGQTAPRPEPLHGCFQSLGLNQEYFLFVGTLEPRKNLPALLAAFASLPSGIKNSTQLVIVGGRGWGNLNLPDLILQLRLESHVKVLGFVDDALLSELYRNTQFLAMPSLYEGFGLPVLEAMSHGVCVLGSVATSIEEIAGECGLMINPRNTEEIATALHRLIGDKALRERLALRSKETAAKFTWEACGTEMLSLLQRAVR